MEKVVATVEIGYAKGISCLFYDENSHQLFVGVMKGDIECWSPWPTI